MSRVLKTEIYRLRHNMTYLAVLLAAAVTVVGFSLLAGSADGNVTETLASFADITPLFTAVVVIGLVHSDYRQGTMKNVVSSGNSRNAIYFGKLLGVFVATIGVVLVLGIATVITVLPQIPGANLDIVYIIKTIALLTLVCLNYSTFFFLLANVLHNSALCVIIAYVFYLFSSAITGFIGSFLHISGLYEFSLTAISTEVANVNVASVTLIHLVVITLVIVALAMIGSFIFSKKDIK